MKLKRLFLLMVFVLVLFCSCDNTSANGGATTNGGSLQFSSSGFTRYNIVVDAKACRSVRKLADSLKPLLGTGAFIATDETPETSTEVIIGHTNRGVTAEYVAMLEELSNEDAFHYIIAEKNGRLIIISNNEMGYLYVMDRLSSAYESQGVLTVPKNCCDVQTVKWIDYYASEHYVQWLAYIEDQKRYDEEQNQLENEMNRYDDQEGNGVMTTKQMIERYKKLVAGFKSEDFGTYHSTSYTSVNTYDTPPVYPGESHPRILFTENSIGKIRENLTAEENAAAYASYMSDSYAPCDGIMPESATIADYYWDEQTMKSIEALAFRYAMTGEELYGYQAIYCMKNVLLTANIPSTVANAYRPYGHVMYATAMVYDWCYDLLTDVDKQQLIAGCIDRIASHLEIVKYAGTENRAPIAMGAMYGHGAEAQLLRDFLAFSIAVYDEAPEIYELVAGRLFSEYREAQNFLYSSGAHWEGDNYGNYRLFFSIYSNFLINRMTDGEYELFDDNMHEVALTLAHNFRPDGQALRIGDNWTEKTPYFNLVNHWWTSFIAGSYYNDSYLKTRAWDGLSKFSYLVGNGDNGVSAIVVLTMNDPSISHNDYSALSLTRTTTFPLSTLYARSAWNDVNAFMVHMRMTETHGVSHAHMDCGSFQIFYKGALASSSGRYEGWGSAHNMGYNMQTVSTNSILVYNPEFADYRDTYRPNLVYSGGQSIRNGRSSLPRTLAELYEHPAYNQVTSLGVANVEKDGKYLYSYMGGDMTKAYDEETVDEVTRYMLAVATDDAARPLVFVTFDRITSDDASFRKSALIHVQQEPIITPDGFAIVTNTKNGNNGKMIVQTVMEDTEFTVIGGEGKEFWLCDHLGNASVSTAGDVAEYGWGRIEISPAEADLTNHMFTVMYVTDADNNSAPIQARDISTDALAGAMILGKAMFFPKNDKLLSGEVTFTLTSGAECFVAGVAAGTWEIYKNGEFVDSVTVSDSEHLITFEADVGSYTVKPIN